MAGVFGANLMSYLRLLTPHELNRLVRKNEKRAKVSLTKLVASELELKKDETSQNSDYRSSKSKMKPDLKAVDDSLSEVSPEQRQGHGKSNDRRRERAPTPSKYRFDHDLKEKESLSTFLLNQKKKTKESQKLLKEKEVLSLYDVISNVDVQPKDKKNSNDEKLDDLSGLLVNKKAS